MRKKLLFAALVLFSVPGLAQQIRLSNLLSYLDAPMAPFEQAMLREGFVCFYNKMNVQGWTCLFAYQPAPYIATPDQASALIQCTHNGRSDVVVYQVRSSEQYQHLMADLKQLGFRMEVAPDERCIFSKGNLMINCRQTDYTNGMRGNYSGHSFTLIRQRY